MTAIPRARFDPMPLTAGETAWNESHIADFRAHGGTITEGPLVGANLLLLTTTGAKSGEPRVSPLGFTRDGERCVVVGSNSGHPRDPAWLANIRADRHVTVEVETERFAALATITTGEERQRLWEAHKAAIPAFAAYETMVARELQVVTLERATG
jgi:deazaflavin-dependent oxidoreductase (nitroreductase family)